MKYLLSLIAFLLLGAFSAYSTHNRAGEITYWHISGLKYGFKIITYTKDSSPADRPELEVDWDDGSIPDIFPRSNGGGNGVLLGNNIRLNEYLGEHTFSGPGVYQVSITDPNRNADIVNLGGSSSDQLPFHVYSELVINPFFAPNNSPRLLHPPIDDACFGEIYVHNAGAYDIDGDSLSYELIPNMGGIGQAIVPYQYPNDPGGGTLTIDPVSGSIIWDSPQMQGEFNIAILIKEWRNGVYIGSVLRDMQITVKNCNNDPPVLTNIIDTCIEAGQLLSFSVIATDINTLQNVTIEGFGSTFEMATNKSTLSFVTKNFFPTYNEYIYNYQWQTDCDHVSSNPYQVYFLARDNDPIVSLVDIKTAFITVIAPSPKNPTANAVGNSINLKWESSICKNAVGYKVYRKSGSYGFTPDVCETGVPAYTGYSYIGKTDDLNDTSFVDTDNFIHGNEYCYMVVACFADGAESYASEEFCASLTYDVPIITHVTVDSTASLTGSDTVIWSMPKELDSITQYPGPYFYELYRGNGFGTPTELVHTTATSNFLALTDTIFYCKNLNTQGQANNFHVQLFSNGNPVTTPSATASSIFLSSTPNDNQIGLSWVESVPWTNNYFEIYRKNGASWVKIDTSHTHSYVDDSLVNGVQYCYYVRGVGEYTLSGIISPLLNRSQIHCNSPVDLTAPCAPNLGIEPDCDNIINTLTWNNPNNSCADDVVGYNIYFSPVEGDSLEFIATLTSQFDTTFLHNSFNSTSIAGCYAVTALDSAQYGNESEFSNIVCVNNCVEYELPNVFSPNGDGFNDLFVPVKNKFIESVEFRVFNRWGQEVFETEDPQLNWDGVIQSTKAEASEGTYYYICIVNQRTLQGIVPFSLTGHLTLIRSQKTKFN